MRIRPYDPVYEEHAVYTLWQETLGSLWPVSQAAFHAKTVGNEAYRPGDHFVAEVDHRIAGFVATQTRMVPEEDSPRGELMVVLVDPRYQRRGIGRALLDHALATLQAKSVRQVQLGAGGLAYFWAGVPVNLPGAWAFFQACGWTEAGRTFDLAHELGAYTTPPEVYARVHVAGIHLANATTADISAILAFEVRHFPAWLRYYEMVIEQEAHADIVVAKDADGAITGTSCATDFRSETGRLDFVWQSLLGSNTGGVGTLGVAEAMRGKGIGLALAAWVTEQLQASGLATSFIGYTWLADWYGKLGYRVWREHHLSYKTL